MAERMTSPAEAREIAAVIPDTDPASKFERVIVNFPSELVSELEAYRRQAPSVKIPSRSDVVRDRIWHRREDAWTREGDRVMIPTLGYPSRKDAIMALAAQGLDRFEIASRAGVKPGTVAVVQHYVRRGRMTRGAETFARVRIERETLASLAAHAAKRGITVDSLARNILQTVIKYGMIDNVLDDGVA